jgi:anti-sigma B factor antagonist
MSDLTITKRQVRNVLIVDLAGKITLGETNRQLHEEMRLLVTEGKRNIILNLAKVSVLDSSGLGELIAGYATLEKSGGKLKLINLPARVTELMTITKLLTVFDVYDSEADGIASYPTIDEKMDKTTQPLDQAIAAEARAGTSLL